MNGEMSKTKKINGESSNSSSLSSLKSDFKNLFNNHLDKVLRCIRVSVGALILLTIVTAILIPQVLPVSGNSFINAKLEWIRTPIDGDLSFDDLKVGDFIPEGSLLGAITNKRVDDLSLIHI